MPDNTSS